MASSTKAANVISSLTDLKDFIDSIPESATLYLDLEGKDLSRNGTISIITILIHETKVTKLIDIQTLGGAAFTTLGTNGKTSRDILEDPEISKHFWDVRNDADALWAHFQVRLAGVKDIQLLENASRAGNKTYLRGLDICVEKDLKLGLMELDRWAATKRAIKALMANDIFSRHPLDDNSTKYCVNDVIHLPALYSTYMLRIDDQWLRKAMEESERRVVEACSPEYEPQSESKKLGPWGSFSDTMLEPSRWSFDSDDDCQVMPYNYCDNDYWSDGKLNSKDVAWDDTFDSCWER